MKSDLQRFISYCIIIFLMLLLLKSCPNEPVKEPEAVRIEQALVIETPAVVIEKPEPEYLSRKEVFLNDSLTYRSTTDKMIYYLGKPDTLKSTEKHFYYQYSSFSRQENTIKWEYIDFRTMRFVWTTPMGNFNFSSTFNQFKDLFPVASTQVLEGKDKITGESITYIKIPENSESESYWIVSFANGKLRSTELKD
ncbi:hypothetical protein EP331_09170 [bacterium]|nr:MAG: hypothetical protein EP331_09170 [bacterium]